MKKFLVILIMFLILFLVACGMPAEEYEYSLEEQYQIGYKAGFDEFFSQSRGNIDQYIVMLEREAIDYAWEESPLAPEEAVSIINGYFDGENINEEDFNDAIEFLFYFHYYFYDYMGRDNADELFWDYCEEYVRYNYY